MSENVFRVAKSVLDGYDKAMMALERDIQRKCDWDIPGDVLTYKSKVRHEQRLTLLEKFVQKRVCPACGRGPLLASTMWVYSRRRVICRQCFERGMENVLRKSMKHDSGKLFGNPIVRYPIDGLLLRSLRERSKVGQYEFARRCGWSRSHQQTIEGGIDQKSVTADTADTILTVLKEAGMVTEDVLLHLVEEP